LLGDGHRCNRDLRGYLSLFVHSPWQTTILEAEEEPMASDGIKKTPGGKYRIRPRDQFGHRPSFTFDTKHEAQAKKREVETAVKNNTSLPPAEIPTVASAAADWFAGKKLAASKQGGPVKESTLAFWTNHIDRFIVPTLGHLRLDKVSAKLI